MNLPHLMLESPTIHRLGWVLLHSLWQGAAVALLLAVVLATLRRRGPRFRYAASCAAMLLLPTIAVATYFLISPPAAPAASSASALAATAIAPPQPEAVGAVVIQANVDASSAAGPRAVEASPEVAPTTTAGPKPALQPVAHRHNLINLLRPAIPWIVLGWAAGVLALSLWNLGGWVSMQRLKALTTRPVDEAVADLARKLCRRLGLSRPPRFAQSAAALSPLVIGALKPLILLPMCVLNELPPAQIESLLAHELAHVLRHDYLANLLQTAIETLLFYHPAVWWISRQTRQERENCCDDLAVNVTHDRSSYVRALAAVASRAPALAPAATGGMLLPRIRRIVGIPDADAARAPRWLAGGIALVLCLIAVALLRVSAAATDHRQDQAKQSSVKRTLRLSVVNADTGKPLPGVRGSYWLDDQNGADDRIFTSNQHGECRIPLETGTKTVGFFYHKDSFVEGMMQFGGEFGVGPVPESYTLRLRPGLHIGGIVEDEEGKGVAGAKVGLTFRVSAPEYPNGLTYGHAETGPDGRWTFDGAPPNPTSIDVFTKHPDFVLESFDHSFGAGAFDALRKKAMVTAIRRGLTVSGNVVDEQGKPIAHADVTPDSFGLISSTQSDDQGQFKLRGVEPGQRHVAAKADGYAPQLVEANVEKAMKPVELRLEKGRVLRGRVADAQGKPVSDAYIDIAIERWRTLPRPGIFVKTDAHGRFVWNGAPSGAVTLSAHKRGYPEAPAVSCTAGQKEIELVFPTALVLRGAAVDDQTSKPIERFAVHLSINQGQRGVSMDRNGADGRFEVGPLEDGKSYKVRVDAAGYLASESPELHRRGDIIEFNARLKRGGGTRGTVVRPDGRPASGADIILWENGAPQVEDGVLSNFARTANVSAKTDASGSFLLPPRTGAVRLFVYHEIGWAELQRAAAASEPITLRPWCRVEGRLMMGGQPWAGQTVWFNPVAFDNDEFRSRQYFRYQVTTDGDGRFVMDRVVDGPATLGLQYAMRMGDGRESWRQTHGVPLDLKPGERKTDVQIGGTGRPVIARVIVPDDLKARQIVPSYATLRLMGPQFVSPPNWDSMMAQEKRQLRQRFEQTDSYQQYAHRVKEFMGPVGPDGSLRIDDVPAGQYSLPVEVQLPKPGEPANYRWVATGEKAVEIPEMPGGRGDEPLDAGSIELKEHHYLDAGNKAPPFEAAAFDGKRLKLSDYRGKYVLLDFWASWCAPCIAEMNTLQRVHDTLGHDDRLVMISISTDDRIDEPARFLRDRKLPWVQGFAGSIVGSPGQAFGVQALPSIWLIGPDGTIIAKDLSGGAIDAAVRQVLNEPPTSAHRPLKDDQ